jgi:hypothetical protein
MSKYKEFRAMLMKENTHTVIINSYFCANWSKLVGGVLGFHVSSDIANQSDLRNHTALGEQQVSGWRTSYTSESRVGLK